MTTAPVAEVAPEVAERIRALRLVVFDFDGVFTDNGVYVFQDGREAVRCNRSDGLGLSKLRELGLELLVLSSEVNPVVAARCLKLQLPCVHGCDHKGTRLGAILEEKGLAWEQTAFVGNDINDSDCLRRVGLPVVVADAHPEVLPLARLRTRTPGGHGAVRELCDLVASVRG